MAAATTASSWKPPQQGRGLWFRGVCTNRDCTATRKLSICAPFDTNTDKAQYSWTLDTGGSRRGGRKPFCLCTECGKELIPIEANLTNCSYRLDGMKIVGLEIARYKGKWVESNPKTRRSCWEEVNSPGGLKTKWDSLTIYVKFGQPSSPSSPPARHGIVFCGLGLPGGASALKLV
ncbi:hypothetical protein BASA81_004472 [Batrachochytrium salamandrivorans]|nr:hypothetical protein BASA81_004472 [Batrachochytrium salamandrivorans]